MLHLNRFFLTRTNISEYTRRKAILSSCGNQSLQHFFPQKLISSKLRFDQLFQKKKNDNNEFMKFLIKNMPLTLTYLNYVIAKCVVNSKRVAIPIFVYQKKITIIAQYFIYTFDQRLLWWYIFILSFRSIFN